MSARSSTSRGCCGSEALWASSPRSRLCRRVRRFSNGGSGEQFSDFTEERWSRSPGRHGEKQIEGLVLSYDANLMKTLEALDLEAPLSGSVAPLRQSEIISRFSSSGAPFRPAVGADASAPWASGIPLLSAITVPSQGHALHPRWPSRSGYPRFCRPGLKIRTLGRSFSLFLLL